MFNQRDLYRRELVLIDGSNFYYMLRDLRLHQSRFRFRSFGQWLAGSKHVDCRYYVGAVRQEHGNQKSQELYARQQSMIAKLPNQDVEVVLGYIMKTDGYHEKGVDVKIAVDLLAAAYGDTYHRSHLVSSDTDLIPAVEKARAKCGSVNYVGFAHQPSYGLKRACSSTRLLRASEIRAFTREAARVAPNC